MTMSSETVTITLLDKDKIVESLLSGIMEKEIQRVRETGEGEGGKGRLRKYERKETLRIKPF